MAIETTPVPASTEARWTRVWLALIVLGGLLLRLWLWWRVPLHQPANDEPEYLQAARDLIAGRGWVLYEHFAWLRAPLYPLFLTGSLLLSGGNLRWAALPNLLVSTLSIPLFYLLGRSVVLGGHPETPDLLRRAARAGLLAAAASALLLTFATFARLWMSEALFTTLFTAALVLLLRWARRPRLGLAAGAGILLGLAALTRSAPLAGLPLLAGWMLWQRQRPGALRPYIVGALVCLLMTLATIAPWTVRNWLAYGGFIPVETGLSYNLWAFNEPREDSDTIFRTLEAIPNPVARSDVATAKGLARLREDPAIVLRNIRRNWFYLWHVKPIEDRFPRASYFEDVPLGLFTLSLVLDDALYVLILAGAGVALVMAPGRGPKLLLVGWLGYTVLVVLLTHGEGRYRHLLYPALIPLAAGASAGGWWQYAARIPRLAAATTAVLLLLVPLLSYPYGWATTNLRRGWAILQGDRSLASADYGAAQRAYGRAADIDPYSADSLLRLGSAYERAGLTSEAIQAYRWAVDVEPGYVASSAMLGNALRRAGETEAAHAAFQRPYVDERALADWAWQHLGSTPPSFLDVGDGLDIGLVGGMYPAEEQVGRRARWTARRAALRLRGGEQGSLARLRISAPRPDRQPVPVTICAAAVCQTVSASDVWRTYEILVPARCEHADSPCDPRLEVTLHAPTFAPDNGGGDQSTGSGAAPAAARQLGVLVDWATVEALGAP